MLEEMQTFCPNCKNPILETFNFCPNCGKKIKNPPVSTTVFSQIKIYALSFLLPPLGLLPGIKYIRQPDQKAKTIGLIAIILTIVSIIISIVIAVDFVNQTNQVLKLQMQQMQTPGL